MTEPANSIPWYGDFRLFRDRIIPGLLVVLPFFITYAVVRWLYDVLYNYAIGPIAWVLSEYSLGGKDSSTAPATDQVPVVGTANEWSSNSFAIDVFSSIMAFVIVLAVLYVAGMFARTRFHRMIDWILMPVPGVSIIYRVVSKVFDAISTSQDTGNFKRVVLVEFPHPGMKVPAFVTSECTDEGTGKTILCVYVPTTPVPSSGYMLLVPESETTPISWDLEVTLQAIVSGGLTVPDTVTYYGETEGPIKIRPT
jgi:uncharacterized membrane protein